MQNKYFFLCALLLIVISVSPSLCSSQEIEPRRWSHLPINSNFVGGGYSFTQSNIYFDPVLQIENAEAEIHTIALKYLRTFELLEKSARVEFTQGYQEGKWKGTISGIPDSVTREGLTDSVARFAVNLYGAPPLQGREFAAYRAATDVETIVGTALAVNLPTGEYMEDKFINLGTNRFTFRPQFGVVHNRGKLSLELTCAIWLYTDNNDFYNGNKLEQKPLYTAQSHLIYTLRPGIWAAASIGYAYGGKSSVNGEEKNDLKENLDWALSIGYPLTHRLGVKMIYLSTRTQQETGMDTDTVAAALSYLW